MDNEIYDEKFVGNILIVGRTACGKTFFTQKLAVNNFFGKLKKTEWVSYIKLTKEREAEIESCFACPVKFHHPQDQNVLKDLLHEFKKISRSDETDNKNNVNNIFGEKTTRDRLIVMDDVSGVADESKNSASFLTVAWKYRYSCIYIFHTIFPEKAIWRSILSQTIIYILPATVPLPSFRKILETACSRKTIKYIPQNALWLNRLFIELANRDDRLCLTIDCSGINKDSLGRFRTEADNPEIQTFNSANDELVYNEFVSKRINSAEDSKNFHFKIIKLKSKTNKNVTFDAADELSNLNKNDTATNGSDKKRTGPDFDIGNGTDNTVYEVEQK